MSWDSDGNDDTATAEPWNLLTNKEIKVKLFN